MLDDTFYLHARRDVRPGCQDGSQPSKVSLLFPFTPSLPPLRELATIASELSHTLNTCITTPLLDEQVQRLPRF